MKHVVTHETSEFRLKEDFSPKFLMKLLETFWSFMALRGKVEYYVQAEVAMATLFFRESDGADEESESYRVTLVKNARGETVDAAIELKQDGHTTTFEIDENGTVTRRPRGSSKTVVEDFLAVLLYTMENRYGKGRK
jgi:hypothetical protein